MEENLTLLFDGQKLVLKKGFVGGIMADFTGAPMGMYIGELDLVDSNMALVHLLRAVIKLNREEFKMDFKQSETFINFALEKALQKEKENLNIDNATISQHEKVVKMNKKDSNNRKH